MTDRKYVLSLKKNNSMKNVNYLLVSILLCVSNVLFAQSQFRECSAAFLGKKMVVNEYTDEGKSSLTSTASGILTVCTAELSEKESRAKDKILFKIAIRDNKTKTLVTYSDKAYSEIDIQNVLKKCKKGDYIVLMTTDSQYALPHNEILVL